MVTYTNILKIFQACKKSKYQNEHSCSPLYHALICPFCNIHFKSFLGSEIAYRFEVACNPSLMSFISLFLQRCHSPAPFYFYSKYYSFACFVYTVNSFVIYFFLNIMCLRFIHVDTCHLFCCLWFYLNIS